MNSQLKVQAAYERGDIQKDLVPVALRSESGWGMATEDQGRRPETTMEALAALKTPFRPHGRVTAGNSSPLTDGATVSLLAGVDTAKELGLSVKMKLVSFGFAGVEPEVMGIGPIPSTEKALKRAGLAIEDIGLFDLNEAFAVQVLSFLDHFNIQDDDPRVNLYGGAIAFGHPLAATGVRLMTQLARQFEQRPDVQYGMTAMCVGLGQGRNSYLGKPSLRRKEEEVTAMTDYRSIDFSPLIEASSDEVITHAYVNDVDLPSGGTLALITLDNGKDHKRPNTLGPRSLESLYKAISSQKERAAVGEIQALAITGKPWIFAAGADLSKVGELANEKKRATHGTVRGTMCSAS
jgi:hypothetical protein